MPETSNLHQVKGLMNGALDELLNLQILLAVTKDTLGVIEPARGVMAKDNPARQALALVGATEATLGRALETLRTLNRDHIGFLPVSLEEALVEAMPDVAAV